jgi:ArsR family metal-binding transcriptional regulator
MSKIALDMAHDGDGAEAAHKSVSESISRARNQGTTDGFNQKDRQRQERTED